MATDRLKREMRLHRDHSHLCESLARSLEQRVKEAVEARGRCAMALAGGQTPLPLFDVLAKSFSERIPWDCVHLFWGDERWVPADHPESNYGVAYTRLVKHLPIPEAQVHPIVVHPTDIEAAAETYDRLIQKTLGTPPRFDVVLLGMGSDGHTASIFAESEALTEQERCVLPVESPRPPLERITLTLKVINLARHVYFMVVGNDKSEALKCAFGQKNTIELCPARFVEPAAGNVIWWVDADAAEGL